MSLDPEVKRQLDLRLATGEFTQDEYRARVNVLMNPSPSDASKDAHIQSRHIQRLTELKARQTIVSSVRTIARIIDLLLILLVGQQLLQVEFGRHPIQISQLNSAKKVGYFAVIAMFVGYIAVWAWELLGGIIIIVAMAVLVFAMGGPTFKPDPNHPEATILFLVIMAALVIMPFLFIICWFSSRALKRSFRELESQ